MCAEIPDLFRVLNMISCSPREINLIFPSTHVFFCLLYKVINCRFSTNIKCPEAMIGDCLKSDNFHMWDYHK